MERRSFWSAVPADCKKAISELGRLKVYNLCGWDYEETFADVWWLVLHEVDMYHEGEFCKEAYRSVFGEGDPSAMDLRQAKKADEWLVRWWPLASKYSQPDVLSDYHREVLGDWGDDGIRYYGGEI